jgi:beta-lactamase regulating signal transducer with metallopeptidase domain
MQTFLAWVLTYAIHSTVLILATWLVCRFVPKLSLASQEALWKLALVGAIATTTVQSATGLEPPWGRFAMPSALATEAAPAVTAPATPPMVAPAVLQHRSGDLVITARREPHAAPAVATTAAPAHEPGAWPWVLVSLIGLGAVFGLVRVAVAVLRLRKQLHARRDVIEDPVLETFLALCQKVGVGKRVRLSTSPALQSPVALVRREICIPERAIFGLDPRQQQSMLAHELAHVLRRDPLWLVAAVIVESVFFFQPLNHLVRRKISEVAEYQCDDWAARHNGTGVHLAKCLAEVAGWIEREPPAPSMAPSMAGHRSPIVRRITRLLDDRRLGVAELRPAWRVGAGLGMLVGVAWLAPGVDEAAAAPAEVRGAGLVEQTPARLLVEDVFLGDGADRARLRIAGTDETVHVEVAAPRAVPQPPPRPRAPEPPPVPRDEFRIRIEGGVFGHVPCCGHGWIEIDLFGLEHLDHFDPFGGPWMWSDDFGDDFVDDYADIVEAQAEALEEALERREEALEEALERAEDAREEALEHAREARERAGARPYGHAFGFGRAERTSGEPAVSGTVAL